MIALRYMLGLLLNFRAHLHARLTLMRWQTTLCRCFRQKLWRVAATSCAQLHTKSSPCFSVQMQKSFRRNSSSLLKRARTWRTQVLSLQYKETLKPLLAQLARTKTIGLAADPAVNLEAIIMIVRRAAHAAVVVIEVAVVNAAAALMTETTEI